MTEQILPVGWDKRLQSTLDLDAAYEELGGRCHFHCHTWRGVLRHIQGRPDDALAHFDEAEARFPGIHASPDDNRKYLMLLMVRVHASLLRELSGSPAARERTDESLERLLAATRQAVDPEQALRIREKVLGLWRMHRGLYQQALEGLENLIQRTRHTPERSLASYIMASAAAHELGLHKQSRRHYENAELTMAFHDDRLTFCQFLTYLLALCRHWGWEREAGRWEETIRVLDCPDSTRRALMERAALLESARRAGKVAAFA